MKYLTEDSAVALGRIWRYSFDPAKNSFENIKMDDWMHLVPRTLGLYIDGELKAAVSNHDYEIFLRGKWMKISGIAGVATLPEVRRKGFVTKLMKKMFVDMREQGQHVSALYPFYMPFYEKLGYRMASELEQVSFAAEELIKRPVEGITVKLVDNFADNKKVYEKVVERYNLIFRRKKIMWEDMFRNSKGYNFVFYRGKEPVGYVKLHFTSGGDGEEPSRNNGIIVMDYFWDSPDARQAFFNFIHDHDSQRKYVKMRDIDPATIYLFLKNGRSLKREYNSGMMFRVIDVAQTLEAITYPAEVAGKCAFAITDNGCPWNNRSYELQVSNGKGSVTEATDDHLDFKSDIGSFSQLISGFFNYNRLVEAGEITKLGDSDLPERLFPLMYNLPRNHF